MNFDALGVSAAVCDRIAERGITTAFPIQEAALPDALAGRDVVGRAPTGSGKTLAFGVALVERTTKAGPRRPRALVLVPTRELAAQVRDELAMLTPDRGRRVLCVYGGTSYHTARKSLNMGVDILVACPGRLEDLLEQGALRLDEVRTVVIDEADRMADMGFLPAVRRIVGLCGSGHQTLLFSATMSPDVRRLIEAFAHDPVFHDVVSDHEPAEVDHFFWHVDREDRVSAVVDIANEHGRAIVFSRTKHGAERLAKQLGHRGVSATAIHGDRTQAQRDRAIKDTKSGAAKILVATDVAARGIHIEAMPCVVHYDPPQSASDYLHRSGRTGRAGAVGTVISLVTKDVDRQVRQMRSELGVPGTADSPDTSTAVRLISTDESFGATQLGSSKPARATTRHEKRPSASAHNSSPSRDTADRNSRHSRQVPSEDPNGVRSPSKFRQGRPRREVTIDSPPPRQQREESKSPNVAVVSYFSASKGYGFAVDAGGRDLFIHFTSIEGNGFRTLTKGQEVSFDATHGAKGLEAKNVRVLTRRARR